MRVYAREKETGTAFLESALAQGLIGGGASNETYLWT